METVQKEAKQEKKVRGYDNEMCLEFDALSYNESFARMAVAAFITPLNPTLEEISDVKTAISEAVTNSIIHGYGNTTGYIRGRMRCPREVCDGKVKVYGRIKGDVLHVEIIDRGCGISDVDKAMEPLFTTREDLDRAGMGFAFMEAFMDGIEVHSEIGKGTTVIMEKKLGTTPWLGSEE